MLAGHRHYPACVVFCLPSERRFAVIQRTVASALWGSFGTHSKNILLQHRHPTVANGRTGFMRLRSLTIKLIAFGLVFLCVGGPSLFAQESGQSPVFKKEELQQLLAPIALYPDELLAQVLMASTYPLQVVQAARWQEDNAKVTGDALDKALDQKDWDPSVKSLVPFPQVVQMMSDKLEWTQKLGDAFLAQQADVMNEVQYLRAKADESGNLKTTKQQTVKKQAAPASAPVPQYIVIEPATPQVVYVPVYNPTVVYGGWWYPAYPPYYYPPPPGAAFVSGFFWGAAVAASAHYWGWGNCDWHGGDININVNRYNEINHTKNQINNGKWEHNPANRGQVPYRGAKTQEKFGARPKATPASREARGFEPGAAGTRDLAKPGTKDLPKAGTLDRPKDGSRDLPTAKAKDIERPSAKAKDIDRPASKDKSARPSPDVSKARDIDRPATRQAKAPSSAAFDVKRGADVRAQSNRGQASRQSMAKHGGASGRRR